MRVDARKGDGWRWWVWDCEDASPIRYVLWFDDELGMLVQVFNINGDEYECSANVRLALLKQERIALVNASDDPDELEAQALEARRFCPPPLLN